MTHSSPSDSTRPAAEDDAFGGALDHVLRAWAAGSEVDAAAIAECWPAIAGRINEVFEVARGITLVPPPFRPNVPGYRILEEAGRGGMGVVYRAVQLGIDRLVALKVNLLGGDDRGRQRFLAEARALGRLRHPHVVTVFEVVELPDLCAYAMEWIDGPSLSTAIESREVAAEGQIAPRVCRLGIAVAQALAAVHEQGLLHRDVKPSNVLLRPDGTPLLSDFGVARDSAHSVTRTGQFLGTPAFAAPEQLRGQLEGLDVRADVYGLAATLHCAIAGAVPFAGHTPTELLANILARRRPSLVAVGAPVDLETIVSKCLEAEPRDRYASALEVADELERVLSLRPIRARPLGLMARATRFVRRNRNLVLVGGVAAALALLAAGAFMVWLVGRWTLDARVAEALREARFTLLEPTHGERVELSNLGREFERESAFSAAPERCVAAYDRVAALDPRRETVQCEREIVAIAAALTRSEGLPTTQWLPQVAPETWAAAKQWSEGSEELVALPGSDRDRQLLGLLAFLCGRLNVCHAAWADLEMSGDPFVDAAAAQLHMLRGDFAIAYGRLARATASWPEAGFLAVNLADCAVEIGDLVVAERELARAVRLRLRDPFDTLTRVRADLRAAQWRDDEAIADYDWLLANRRSVTTRKHYAALRERRGEWALACELWCWLAEKEPNGAGYAHAALAAWHRLWTERSHDERLDAIVHCWRAEVPSTMQLMRRLVRAGQFGGIGESGTVAAPPVSFGGGSTIGPELTLETLMWIDEVASPIRRLPTCCLRLFAHVPLAATGAVGAQLARQAPWLSQAARAGWRTAVGGIAMAVALLAPTAPGQVTWVPGPAPGPSARNGIAHAYEPTAGRLIVYGGYDGTSALQDVWSLHGGAWNLVSTTSPLGARVHGRMTPDGTGGVILFGGYDALSPSAWAPSTPHRFDATSNTWSPLPVGPSARVFHAMAFDRHRGVVLVFGGQTQTAYTLNDLWEYDVAGGAWNQVVPNAPGSATQPVSGNSASLVYDEIRQETVMCCGADRTGSATYVWTPETWTWNGAAWNKRAPATFPPARLLAGVAWDRDRGCAIVFGGYDFSAPLADVWEWDGVTWLQRVLPAGPAPRHNLAMVYDESAREAIVFGGRDGSTATFFNDTWILRPQTPWTLSDTGPGCPSQLPPFLTPSLARRPGTGAWIGQSITLDAADLPPNAVALSALVIDFANPSQSLPPYGQPGCVLRAGLAGAKVLYFGTTTTFTMAVPNTPTLLGLSLYSQTVSLLTSQSAGQTIVDAVSNGLLFTIGTR